MAHSGSGTGKPIKDTGLDALSDRFKNTVTSQDEDKDTNFDKPDFRELDLGSPVSPLTARRRGLTTTATTTSSSSSSSGSISGRHAPTPLPKKSQSSHSGELSCSVESSPTGRFRPNHTRSGSFSGSASVTSPPVNVLPAGNIFPSGKISKTGMAKPASKTDVLGSGTGNYGHGSIMRGGSAAKSSSGSGGDRGASSASPMNTRGRPTLGEPTRRGGMFSTNDPEEFKRMGNDHYLKANYAEALSLYDKAIAISPGNAAYHCNRAAALIGLKLLQDAVRECEEAIRLDPSYVRARQRLGSLFISLGQVENARRHLCFPGLKADPTDLQKLQVVERHLIKCTNARKVRDWNSTLREADNAIASGADACPQLMACRAEALLKLHQVDEADVCLANISKLHLSDTLNSQLKFFGILSDAYLLFVRAQIDLACGRFDDALTAVQKAHDVDSRNVEVPVLLNNVRLVVRARARGNELYKSERFTEACSAYGEGLRIDPSNSILYCNRAACWSKLEQWDRSLEDSNQALRFHPNYPKALLRRATSYTKLERWNEAVRDYEVLRRANPLDNAIAEALFHAQVALRKSRGEEVSNMKFGGEVELVSSSDQFRAAISSPGVSVVHFLKPSNLECKQISAQLNTLCAKYPSINFLKVDVEESPAIANAENVRIFPTLKIYKKGSRVKEIVCPSPEMLESSVGHYSL